MLQLRTSFCQSHRERGRNPVGNTADEGERAARWKDSNRKEKYRGQRALDHAKQPVYSIPNSFKALSQPHNQQHTQSYLNTFSSDVGVICQGHCNLEIARSSQTRGPGRSFATGLSMGRLKPFREAKFMQGTANQVDGLISRFGAVKVAGGELHCRSWLAAIRGLGNCISAKPDLEGDLASISCLLVTC